VTPTRTPTNTRTPIPPPLLCQPTPLSGCREELVSQKGLANVRKSGDGTSNKLVWKWKKGDTTELAAFGDPVTGTTDYELCLYEELSGAPFLIMTAAAPAGGTCGGGTPCWKETSSGFRYKDSNETPDGVQKIVLKEGAAGQARIVWVGKGADLRIPGMPLGQPVVVQLVNSLGECWSASYSPPPVTNTTTKFKDKND
jgi:hypothetical protein